jgi:hypothetical protein
MQSLLPMHSKDKKVLKARILEAQHHRYHAFPQLTARCNLATMRDWYKMKILEVCVFLL